MEARQKKVLMILVPATCFLVYKLAFSVLPRLVPAESAASPVIEAVEPGPAGSGAIPEIVQWDEQWKQQQEIDQLQWGRDPFAEHPEAKLNVAEEAPAEEPVAASAPPDAPKLTITMISKNDNRWLAVVNGMTLTAGDEAAPGFRVSDMSKDTITLTGEGWTFIYTFDEEKPVITRVMEKQ